ncbi:hypothetical protein BRC81_09675 [Halobacteriales archaeon QS_1_68_20]|nr:MAG: hypothetical protein BRC81_09675 [Halobacteriales archaeon QS_1_68_20]
MTRRPRLQVGAHLWRGLGAVALFGVMAAVFLTAEFGDPAGLGAIESVTAGIGYALFDIPNEALDATGTEPFLVAFIVIAVVLDAALEGAVLLARREEGGQIVEALTTRGGEE